MRGNDNVKTAIRWRPITANRNVAVEKIGENIVYLPKSGEEHIFDHIFDSSDQAEVYNALMKPLVDKAIEGFNCTFLANGQTGSGKTYTMGFEGCVDPEHRGIAIRTMNSLFNHKDASKFKMTVSFVEIYNDQAFDLLGDTSTPFYKQTDLKPWEVTRKSVKSESEVESLLLGCSKKRRVRSTNMNSSSSRSHAIFTIYLGTEAQGNMKRESVINLVDLAGSEGVKRNGNMEKEAQEESKSINKGLLALHKVIKAMSKQKNHIPTRDSAITTILKDSIKVESYLTLLGCVNPYDDDYSETLSTLKFVKEAKELKMTPAMNKCIEEYKKSKTPCKETKGKRSQFANSLTLKTPTLFKKPLVAIQNRRSFSAKGKTTTPRLVPTSFSTLKPLHRIHRQSMTRKIPSRRSLFGSSFSKPVVNSLADDTFQNTTLNDVNFANASTSSVIDSNSTVNQSQNPDENAQPKTAFKNLLQAFNIDQNLVDSPLRREILNNFKDMVLKKMGQSNNAEPNEEDKGDVKPEIEMPKEESQMFAPKSSSPVPEPDTTVPIETSITAPNLNWNPLGDSYANSADDKEPTLGTDETNRAMEIDQNGSQMLLSTSTEDITLHYEPQCNEENFEHVNKLEVIEEGSEMKSVDNTVQDSLQKSAIAPTNVKLSLIEGTQIEPSSFDYNLDESINIDKSESVAENHLHFDVQNEDCEMIVKAVAPLVIQKTGNTEISGSSIYEVVKTDAAEMPPMVGTYEYNDQHSPPTTIATHDSLSNEKSFGSLFYESSENSAIEVVSKAPAEYAQAPLAPRIILHRIENMQQYKESMKRIVTYLAENSSQNKRPKVARANGSGVDKATKKRNKPNAAPSKSTSTSTAIVVNANSNQSQSQKILHILNTGSVQDLKKLHQIGQKKAEQIFTYRDIHGIFDSIDAMKKMPFWTENTHKRFLVNNFLV